MYTSPLKATVVGFAFLLPPNLCDWVLRTPELSGYQAKTKISCRKNAGQIGFKSHIDGSVNGSLRLSLCPTFYSQNPSSSKIIFIL